MGHVSVEGWCGVNAHLLIRLAASRVCIAPSSIRSCLTVDAVDAVGAALAASPGATSRALWSAAQTLVKWRFTASEKRHSRHETGMKRLFNHVHLNTPPSASAQRLCHIGHDSEVGETVSGTTIGADGEVITSVTVENADELKTRKVGKNGQVYLGKDYSGERVVAVFRVIEEEKEESDVPASEDTEN